MVKCRILPTVVPNQTLQNMRHERLYHILKGTVAKCDRCSRTFTSQELVWNAIGNWVQK